MCGYFSIFPQRKKLTDILNSDVALISDQVGSIITDTFIHDFCFTNILKCTLSSWSRVLSEKEMVGNIALSCSQQPVACTSAHLYEFFPTLCTLFLENKMLPQIEAKIRMHFPVADFTMYEAY
jgi:hypothetical protein